MSFKHPQLIVHSISLLYILFMLFDRGFGLSPEKAPFRDAYSKIGNVRGFTRAPLLCLTATAAKQKRKQIIKTLYMKNVLFISKPPDKNNIIMSVQKTLPR